MNEYAKNAAMWKLVNKIVHVYYPDHCKCHFHRHEKGIQK